MPSLLTVSQACRRFLRSAVLDGKRCVSLCSPMVSIFLLGTGFVPFAFQFGNNTPSRLSLEAEGC